MREEPKAGHGESLICLKNNLTNKFVHFGLGWKTQSRETS